MPRNPRINKWLILSADRDTLVKSLAFLSTEEIHGQLGKNIFVPTISPTDKLAENSTLNTAIDSQPRWRYSQATAALIMYFD